MQECCHCLRGSRSVNRHPRLLELKARLEALCRDQSPGALGGVRMTEPGGGDWTKQPIAKDNRAWERKGRG